MDTILDTQAALLSLLRNELWRTPLPRTTLAPSFSAEVLKLARQQSVTGMAVNALITNGVALGEELAFQAYSDLQQVRARNEALNAELLPFAAFMKRHGVDIFVVKGQVVAQTYQDAMVRQAGDVDFYVLPTHYERACRLIEKQLDVTLSNHAAEKHVEFRGNGVQFEMHSRLADFARPRHRRQWERILREELSQAEPFSVCVADADVPTLPPTLHVFYIFCHIVSHLLASGIGLRQFCDWAAWLHQYRDVIAWDKLQLWAEQLGMVCAHRVLGVVLVDYLGLPQEEFPLVLTGRDRRQGARVLRNVFQMGNFGFNVRGTQAASLRRSLETGAWALRQSVAFSFLAPGEAMWRLPRMIHWYFKR